MPIAASQRVPNAMILLPARRPNAALQPMFMVWLCGRQAAPVRAAKPPQPSLGRVVAEDVADVAARRRRDQGAADDRVEMTVHQVLAAAASPRTSASMISRCSAPRNRANAAGRRSPGSASCARSARRHSATACCCRRARRAACEIRRPDGSTPAPPLPLRLLLGGDMLFQARERRRATAGRPAARPPGARGCGGYRTRRAPHRGSDARPSRRG